MPTTNEVYNTEEIPHGGLSVEVFRAGVSLGGGYAIESLNAREETTRINRTDADGAPNGFILVPNGFTANAVIMQDAVSSPTLRAGDYFSASTENQPDGTPIVRRWVVEKVQGTAESGQLRKQALDLVCDEWV